VFAVDTYGTTEVARLLGVSSKRVRQLHESGRLPAVSKNPLRFTQEAVHTLRDERRTDKRAKSPDKPVPPSTADLSALVEMLTKATEEATEARTLRAIRDRAHEEAKQALGSMQAERDALAAQVQQLSDRLARRRWGRKG
jgi:DNA-binding transcriptional MerR regulator